MSNSSEITKELFLKHLRQSKQLEKQDNLLDALTILDKVSSQQDPDNTDLMQKISVQVARLCNKLSINAPNKVTYLRRAEQSLLSWVSLLGSSIISSDEKVIRMILLTYNNWATFHQSGKNYHMALSYLMKGLQIIDENDIEEPDSLQFVAKTKLNISALYSELRRYAETISYAEDCLKTLQSEFKFRLSGKDVQSLNQKDRNKAKVMITTYVIAFYNIGLAEEHLNNREGMLQAFRNAINIGTPFLDSSNEVLLSARRVVEGHPIKSKALALTSLAGPAGRPAADKAKGKTQRKSEGKFSLSFGSLDKKSAAHEEKEKKLEEVRKPGRYYSDAKLKKLSDRLDHKEGMNFVSADQYFYREISRLMNVSSDCKHLRPLTTSAAMSLCDRQVEEKMKISDLRLKKHHHSDMNAEVSDVAFKVQQDINRLKQIDEDKLKKQEIQMKSKMNTKVYKQLLRSLNHSKKYAVPSQRKP